MHRMKARAGPTRPRPHASKAGYIAAYASEHIQAYADSWLTGESSPDGLPGNTHRPARRRLTSGGRSRHHPIKFSSIDDVADQFTEPTTTDEALALSVLESVTVLEAVVRAFHETLAKRRAADLHAVHG